MAVPPPEAPPQVGPWTPLGAGGWVPCPGSERPVGDYPLPVTRNSNTTTRRRWEPSAAVAAIASSVIASALTGVVSVVVMERQLNEQTKQIEVQAEEDRETARTSERQQRYADFLAQSAAITSRTDELVLAGDDGRSVRKQALAIRKQTERLRSDVERLAQEQTRLFILGPTTMGFLSFDITDLQRRIVGSAGAVAILRLVGENDRTSKDTRALLRDDQDDLARLTNELTVAAIFETGGEKTANPAAEKALTKRLNDEAERRLEELRNSPE